MKHICLRCGHTWQPRTDATPVQCPRCKSTVWDHVGRTVSIYALFDLSRKQYIYVGQSNRPQKRLSQYRSQSGAIGQPLQKRIEEICKEGGTVHLVILEEVRVSDANEREQYWITRLKAEGEPLLNNALPRPYWGRKK